MSPNSEANVKPRRLAQLFLWGRCAGLGGLPLRPRVGGCENSARHNDSSCINPMFAAKDGPLCPRCEHREW